MAERTPSESEIAHMNVISIDAVRKLEKSAMEKLKSSDFVQDLKKTHGTDPIFEDNDNSTVEYSISKGK